MNIKELNWGGMASPLRGSLKDTSNLPQRNQSDELPIPNAEKVLSVEPDLVLEKNLQSNPTDYLDGKSEGLPYMMVTFAYVTADLQDSMSDVEEKAQQIVSGKEWDVSLNEKDELVIYGDDLTDDEREALGQLLQDSGIDQKLMTVRDDLVDAFAKVQLEPRYLSSRNADVFDSFTMDKASFGQVFRLREHVEVSKAYSQGSIEGMMSHEPLLGAADSLSDQVRKRGNLDGELPKGYVVPKGFMIDTHV